MLHGEYAIWWTDIAHRSRVVCFNQRFFATQLLRGLRRLGYRAELLENL